MNILYMGNVPFPEGHGITHHFRSLFTKFAEKGHNVFLLIPDFWPTKPLDYLRLQYGIKKEQIEKINVTRVLYHLSIFIPNIFFTVLIACKLIKKNKIDVIFFYHVNRGSFSAILSAKICDIPLICDYGDSAIGAVSHQMIQRKKELLYCKLSDTIICISKTLYKEILENKIDKGKVYFIHPSAKIPRIKKKTKNMFIVTMVSSFQKDDGIPEVIQAVSILTKKIKNIQILLVGYIPDWLDNVIDKNNMKKYCRKISFVSHDEMKFVYEITDVFVLPHHNTFTNRVALSTKMGEYFYSGIPVITTAIGDWKKLLRNHENALIVKENSPLGIAREIKYIHDNKNKAFSMGKNGKKMAMENFNRVKNFKKLYKILQSWT